MNRRAPDPAGRFQVERVWPLAPGERRVRHLNKMREDLSPAASRPPGPPEPSPRPSRGASLRSGRLGPVARTWSTSTPSGIGGTSTTVTLIGPVREVPRTRQASALCASPATPMEPAPATSEGRVGPGEGREVKEPSPRATPLSHDRRGTVPSPHHRAHRGSVGGSLPAEAGDGTGSGSSSSRVNLQAAGRTAGAPLRCGQRPGRPSSGRRRRLPRAARPRAAEHPGRSTR